MLIIHDRQRQILPTEIYGHLCLRLDKTNIISNVPLQFQPDKIEWDGSYYAWGQLSSKRTEYLSLQLVSIQMVMSPT